MISMTLMIVLFVSIGLIGIGVLYHWGKTNKQKSLCIKSAMQKQFEVTNGLNQLIALNPKSTSLHRKHRKAQLQLAAAMASQNPVAMRLAQRHLAKVKAALMALDLRQRHIISNTNLKLSLWHSDQAADGNKLIHIARLPAYGLAPKYLVQKNSLKKYAIWKSGLVRPHKLLKTIMGVEIDKNWKWHCGASIEKRKKKWKPRLIEAKLFWNSPFSLSY